MTHLDDLPQQAKNEMWFSIHDVLGPDVDNAAANGAGRVEGKSLVLVDSEGVQLSFVDSSFINSA